VNEQCMKSKMVQQTLIMNTRMYIREARSWTVFDMITPKWWAEFEIERTL
jgi:hypothetical protein